LGQEHVCGDPVKTAGVAAGYSRSSPYPSSDQQPRQAPPWPDGDLNCPVV